MARAYRAKKTMPDMEDKKDKPDKEAPKNAKGAPRDIAAIEAEILKTRLAGGDVAALLDEWLAAKWRQPRAAALISGASPAPAPEMGMKPEEAYQRKVNAEAVKGVRGYARGVRRQEGLLRKQPTIAGVKEALDFVGKESAKMGFEGHPAMRGKGDDDGPKASSTRRETKRPWPLVALWRARRTAFQRAASGARRKNNARRGSSCGFP